MKKIITNVSAVLLVLGGVFYLHFTVSDLFCIGRLFLGFREENAVMLITGILFGILESAVVFFTSGKSNKAIPLFIMPVLQIAAFHVIMVDSFIEFGKIYAVFSVLFIMEAVYTVYFIINMNRKTVSVRQA